MKAGLTMPQIMAIGSWLSDACGSDISAHNCNDSVRYIGKRKKRASEHNIRGKNVQRGKEHRYY